MQRFKKYLGYCINGMIIDGIQAYYDASTNRMEYAFTFNNHLGINCDLFIKKYFN